jgi:hypothetical protein
MEPSQIHLVSNCPRPHKVNTCTIKQSKYDEMLRHLGISDNRPMESNKTLCQKFTDGLLSKIGELRGWKVADIVGEGQYGIVLSIWDTQNKRHIIKIHKPGPAPVQTPRREFGLQRYLAIHKIAPKVLFQGLVKLDKNEYAYTVMEAMDITLHALLECIHQQTHPVESYLRMMFDLSRPRTNFRADLIFSLFYACKHDKGRFTRPLCLDEAMIEDLMLVKQFEDVQPIRKQSLLPRYVGANTTEILGAPCTTLSQHRFKEEYSLFRNYIQRKYSLALNMDRSRADELLMTKIQELPLLRNRYVQVGDLMTEIKRMLEILRRKGCTHGDLNVENIMVHFLQDRILTLQFVDMGFTSLFSHEQEVDIMQLLRTLHSHMPLATDLLAFCEQQLHLPTLASYSVLTDHAAYYDAFRVRHLSYSEMLKEKNLAVR